MKRLYMMAKPYHVGVDVDGLAYPLYRPTVRSHQTRGWGLLPSIVLSYHCHCRWCPSRDVKLPGPRYLMES
jgi:hypothetical protein